MESPVFKDACRLFWIVKGHLNCNDNTILDCYIGYFKRVWYDQETYYKEEGFEEAFLERQQLKKNYRRKSTII